MKKFNPRLRVEPVSHATYGTVWPCNTSPRHPPARPALTDSLEFGTTIGCRCALRRASRATIQTDFHSACCPQSDVDTFLHVACTLRAFRAPPTIAERSLHSSFLSFSFIFFLGKILKMNDEPSTERPFCLQCFFVE